MLTDIIAIRMFKLDFSAGEFPIGWKTCKNECKECWNHLQGDLTVGH